MRLIIFVIILIGNGEGEAPKMEDMENDDTLFAMFNIVVKAGGKPYPGVIINGVAVATSPHAIGNNTAVCFLSDETCQPTVGNIIVDGEIGYYKCYIYPAYSQNTLDTIFQTEPEEAESCVSVSFVHIPIKVIVQGPEVECSGCRHMDSLFCDHKYVGILMDGKRIVTHSKLLQYAVKNIGNDESEEMWKEVAKKQALIRKTDDDNNSSTYYYRNLIMIDVIVVLLICFIN